MIVHRVSTEGPLADHLRAYFRYGRLDSFVWTQQPIEQSLPEFEILRVNTRDERAPFVFATHGADAVLCDDGDRYEFFLTSSIDDPAHVETLTMVANFHADPKYRLCVGRIVDIGHPWLDGSPMDHLLVSLPYPFGSKLENFSNGGVNVRLLWLIPIWRQEAEFARKESLEAIEQRFESMQINYLDSRRKPVV